MNFHPAGLATGIGSLPHTDPFFAVSLVKKYFPYLPHWPQLPRATRREGYLIQFLQLLQELELLQVRNGNWAYFTSDDPAWPERLARFYEIYLQAASGNEESLDHFAFPQGAAEGFYHLLRDLMENGTGRARFLKGQIVGLLTVGFQITDPEGRPAYYNSHLRDVLLKQLSLQAAWQVRTLGKFGLPVLIFMDDPVIYSYGMSERIGVTKEEIVAALGDFTASVRSQGGLAGVHSCADLDWSLLLESDLDIISFDAYQFAESFSLYPELIQTFLAKGGVVAWGLTPTSNDVLNEDVDSLIRRASRILDKLRQKRVELDLLQAQALVTPACGTGTLTEDLALRVYELTAAFASRWNELFGSLTTN
ncbi:MAG: hypothetical protein QHH75_01025 [Bacillota bacterium]|nr:hypothetical protein [Bacillota bacterium]